MPEDTKGSERRRYFRVTPSMSNPVLTTLQLNTWQGKSLPVKDISLGGVAIYMPEDIENLPPGTQIPTVMLNLPNVGSIQASGVVKRLQQDEDNSRTICALEFTRMPIHSDRKLYNYLNQRQRELKWFSKSL